MAKKRAKASRKKSRSTGKSKPRSNKTAVRKKRSPKKAAINSSDDRTTRSPDEFSDDQIESFLRSGQHEQMLEDHFGEELYHQLSELARQSRLSSRRAGQRVLVLPGILGSKLGTKGKIFNNTIWLDPIDVIAGNLVKLKLGGSGKAVTSLGVMLHTYLPAKLRLAIAGFDAAFHHFDWRHSIDRLGNELAKRIVSETGPSERPSSLSLVAHSMGGLVARRALKVLGEKEQLDRVNHLVMLGTPNFGSFAPAMVVQSIYPTVRKIAALDRANSAEDLSNKIFSDLPGLLEMLPFPERYSTLDLFNLATWPEDRPQPKRAALTAAKRIHKKLLDGDQRCVMIAGIDQPTVTDLRAGPNGEFEYFESRDGDGTVPLDFAVLPGIDTYYAEKSHGQLPSSRTVLQAVIDILEVGGTSRLLDSWTRTRAATRKIDATRMEAIPFEGRRCEEIFRSERRSILDEFAAIPVPDIVPITPKVQVYYTSNEPINIGRQRQHQISLQLAQGSITDVKARAAVLGVFQDVDPGGPAKNFDQLLDGAVTEFVSRNMFSAKAGEVFILPTSRRLFALEFVVFAGLGQFGRFNVEVLKLVAENVARTLIRSKVDDFAFVPMGSGSGMSVTDSVSSLIDGLFRGILEADDRDRLSRITICEFDEDRYGQLRTEVLRLATTALFDDVEVTVREEPILTVAFSTELAGRHKSVISPGKEPVYLFIQEQGRLMSKPASDEPFDEPNHRFQVSLLGPTNNATVISESIKVSKEKLVRHLEHLESQSFSVQTLPEFGRKLASLVLPKEIISILKEIDDTTLVIIHDAQASRVPWETIEVGKRLIAVTQGITRKYAAENLSIGKWLDSRALREDIEMLLVVNPTADLPGADAEGKRIKEVLGSISGIRITELNKQQATWNRVRSELRGGKYDVIHYAGHAFFDPNKRSNSGILCHGDRVLSGADLSNLQHLPALAFFNACESGRVRKPGERRGGRSTQDRVDRNVGLAEAFLRGGVANYVGTYWPVGDATAKSFAGDFYTALLQGDRISEAILKARKSIVGSIDCTDYIHFGNPNFVLKICN